MNASLVSRLARTRQVALTTVAADDREYCDRLQNALVGGSHELLYWGVGPPLRRGDIVALYVPKTKYLPDSEHGCVRRVYFAAADSAPGRVWNQHVFLNRRLDLERAITYRELTGKIGLSFRHIMAAGLMTAPLSEAACVKLLSIVAARCAGGLAALRSRARAARTAPEVCISYSGHDWMQAHRLKLWMDAAGLAPFFVSPVGRVLAVERDPLTDLLSATFSAASVVVCLVPEESKMSEWIELELSIALEYASRLILVRTDAKRPWPTHSRAQHVSRYTLGPAGERELVARVTAALAAARRRVSSDRGAHRRRDVREHAARVPGGERLDQR